MSNKRRGFPELRNQRTFKEPFWIKKKKKKKTRGYKSYNWAPVAYLSSMYRVW